MMLMIIIGILWYLFSLEGDYTVKQSKVINSDIHTVFNKITDFKTWPEWNPWLIHEPNAKLEFSENCQQTGGYYKWDGDVVGAGKLKHIRFDRPHQIIQKLRLTRPYQSVNEIRFDLSESDKGTKVTWTMYGTMPFLFLLIKKKTKHILSKDYSLGLTMLNGLLDSSSDSPSLDFKGEVTIDQTYSLCKHFSGSISDMKETKKETFPKLKKFVAQQQTDIKSFPFTAYYDYDANGKQFECDMAVPVEQGIKSGDYQLKKLAGGRYYKVTLQGDYKFLELAWYTALVHVEMHQYKLDKSRPSLEVYENDLQRGKSKNEIQTAIYIAIK